MIAPQWVTLQRAERRIVAGRVEPERHQLLIHSARGEALPVARGFVESLRAAGWTGLALIPEACLVSE